MAKRTFQDIVPPEKRTIRNIPIPEGRKPRLDIEPPRKRAEINEPLEAPKPTRRSRPEPENEPAWVPPQRPRTSSSGRKGSRWGLWIVVVVVLLVLAFAISSLLADATVKVTERNAAAQVSGTFTASRTGEDDTIPFDIIKVSRDESKSISADAAAAPAASSTAEKSPATKASGQIVIYNNQSSSSQTLIANTRFQTSDGLIYRISKAVAVPGTTIKDGQKVPGSVEVTVTADQAGAKYDIGLVDFKIPGFKGDPRYDTIYARSKTPMTGGADEGSAPGVSSDTVSQTRDEIDYDLKQALLSDAKAQIPQNFTTIDSGLIYSFTHDAPASDPANPDSAKITEHGTLYAVIVNETSLGQAVADRFLPVPGGGDVVVSNLPDLNFTISSTTPFDPEKDTQFDFTLNGTAQLVWTYDQAALKKDLEGIGKNEVNSILAKYPSIKSADVVVRPFWNRNLPKDPQKITITNVVSQSQ
ncbi:MAG TPA: hypothetical protein VHF05_02215 [Candidatus Paceibacterota bacterium]|nr:hypothetical protein [Candidatus Paceibacterota bacterium]